MQFVSPRFGIYCIYSGLFCASLKIQLRNFKYIYKESTPREHISISPHILSRDDVRTSLLGAKLLNNKGDTILFLFGITFSFLSSSCRGVSPTLSDRAIKKGGHTPRVRFLRARPRWRTGAGVSGEPRDAPRTRFDAEMTAGTSSYGKDSRP